MKPRPKSLSGIVSGLCLSLAVPSFSQVSSFPYTQSFDSVATPNLPPGWSSTQNRVTGTNDFTTNTSTPQSPPNAVLSTNATVSQSLFSPLFDFRNQVPDRLTFFTRRSATHLARVVVEASLDSGTTFPIQLGDSLTNSGSTNYVAFSVPLPGTIASRSNVKFRWRVIADAGGNTGTLRIDDITVTVQTSQDLSIGAPRFSPPTPIEQDSVAALVFVKNVGLQVAQSFLVNFYNDLNNDSLPQPGELIAVASNAIPLAVSDSVDVVASLGAFSAGQRFIIAQVVYQPDQNPQNDRMGGALKVGHRPQSVVINEIMYAPTSTEPEWVELYNTRSDSINIKDWLISDNIVATKRVITATSLLLPPRGFVVLTKDSAALIDVHPDIQSRIVHLPSMPTLNNAGDAVVIYDNRSVTMDSLSYLPSWGGNTGGKSLERIDPAGSSTAQANWGASRHPDRSTPGRRNSLTRKDYDIALDSLLFSPMFPLRGDSVVISARIRNVGFQSSGNFVVRLFDDVNSDSIAQPEELLSTLIHTITLPPLDSLLVSFALFHPTRMDHLLIATVAMPSDEDTLNNRSLTRVLVGIPRNSIVINEVMYSPSTEPEWVELYNTTAESVDVKGWRLSNRTTSTRYLLGSTSLFMKPHGYAVITKDTALLLQQHLHVDGLAVQVSTMPTFLFNNSGDAVVVYDGRNATMDSMNYVSSWGGNTGGKSLERVDPVGFSTIQSNWGTSRHPERSTPGTKNSLARKDFDIALDALFISPAFPLRGDSVMVWARIRNIGFQPAGNLVVRLFDDINSDSIPQPQELLATLIHPGVFPPLDSLLLSFPPFHPTRTEHLLIAKAGISEDEDTLNNTSFVRVLVGIPENSVVINEIMYSPVAEPEWVELYNTSAESVDVRGWKIGNRITTNRYPISSASIFVPPRGCIVVTKDTALLLQRYHRVDGVLVQVAALPTFLFNNTGDAVVAFDQGGQRLDSIRYAAGWGGDNGVSLERIDALSESNDSTNWSSSADTLHGTPGKANSVVAMDYDLQATKTNTLATPPRTPVTLFMTVKNIGRISSTAFDVAFFDDRNRDSVAAPDELITRIHVLQTLARGETLRVSAQWSEPSPGIHTVIARVEYAPDQRLANNSTSYTVKVGYEPRAIVVNEIMYAPFTNEAEYVELMNISSMSIDLSGWKLTDRPGTSGSTNEFPLISHGRSLRPGEYFVIASDSSLLRRFSYLDTLRTVLLMVANQSSFGLNNDGDAVVIRDATLSTIDSVAYLPSWHNPAVTDVTGRSLEKIHPSLGSNDARSWSTCVPGIGGTPGLANSVFAISLPAQAKLSCSPNPFSPDGDGMEDFSVIHYELPTNVAVASLKIFDVKGRLIRHLVNSEPSGAQRDVVWDGYDDERQRARVGIYIVFVEGLNEGGGSVYSAKGVVVLAAKL